MEEFNEPKRRIIQIIPATGWRMVAFSFPCDEDGNMTDEDAEAVIYQVQCWQLVEVDNGRNKWMEVCGKGLSGMSTLDARDEIFVGYLGPGESDKWAHKMVENHMADSREDERERKKKKSEGGGR